LGNFKAGVGRVCITPPVGLIMAGYGERNQLSKGVHDDLYAKALVLDNGITKLSIVAADLLGLDKELVAKIRQIVEKRTGIKKDKIMIAASHTHSGPEITKEFKLLGIPMEEKPIEGLSKNEFIDHLRDTVARWVVGSVYIANNNLEEAKIGVDKGEVHTVGLNRRDLKGPMDPEVGVIRIDNMDGNPMAILMNFTCHPTVLSSKNYLFSADYPGCAMKTVETVLGGDVIAMFTNGACGDISTRFVRREQTFREVERLGVILGSEVLKIAEGIETTNQVTLKAASEIVRLPVRKFPTLEEAEKIVERERNNLEKLKKQGAPAGELRVAYTSLEGAEITLKLVKAGISRLKTVETEMQVMAINDVVFVGEPGELFVEIGKEIKKQSGLRNTFVVGYANDTIGYVPTKKAYEEGLYETFSTLFSPDCGQIITGTALKLISSVTNRP